MALGICNLFKNGSYEQILLVLFCRYGPYAAPQFTTTNVSMQGLNFYMFNSIVRIIPNSILW